MRRQILDRFLRGMEMQQARKNAGTTAAAATMSTQMVPSPLFGKSLTDQTVTRVLLPLPPASAPAPASDRQALILQLVQDPVYQLK